ncbi:MerR family transcriptional regulator [Lactobacillus xylocopicola]|uniref:MerR family transcriptional regulator n=1 Tax=Lactobacillus xylocopicola TaxID=2976676 RepID=A0ABM8BEX5_9LACO|nr:MerR family transcriptional regulator [Lactobacillus xylocopicola]BDR59797.1 MerR family transcriptional regulator [Lactobacillus xylocopicola]
MEDKAYKIGQFSNQVKLSIDTLRYYEKEKLIVPKRDQNNRRIYDESDLRWIEFIKRLKQTGMPIKEIQQYSQLRYQGDSTINERLELLYQQKERLAAESAELAQHIAFLNHKIGVYQAKLKRYDH